MTELVWFASPHGLTKFVKPPINGGQTRICPTTCAKSLRVTLDDNLKLAKHVSNVFMTCFFQIWQLRHIRRYLNFEAASTLINSFVMTRIDYYNSLFAAAPVYQTDQLQRMPISAARLLLRVPKSDWELRNKVRDRLHWLRAPERASYKLCTVVYKALRNIASSYLAELCVPIVTDAHRSHLRSADGKELKVLRHKLSTYGPRSFSIAGPKVRNSLPSIFGWELIVRTVTSGLKSFLFRISYDL